jgi:hypothetical protein
VKAEEPTDSGLPSTRSDYGTFLHKVAHVPRKQELLTVQRQSTATPFVNHERFELRRYLGAGSFGVVYEAFDRQFGLRVAIKVLSNAQPERLFLFKQEFRAVADVVHPNLVGLFELFASDGAWFFTMELVDGRPLLQTVPELSERRASESGEKRSLRQPGEGILARVVRPFLQLARGLRALHDAGFIHRDLKPSNVLIDGQGRVVVVDFGLAKALRGGGVGGPGAEGVLQGKVVGTPGYLAPEVLRGEAESRASDWFSFGVMLYEALTGKRPFPAEADTRTPALAASFLTPSELGIALPPALEDLCMALLSDEGSRRPGAEAVIELLTRVLGEDLMHEALLSLAPADPQLYGREDELARLHDAYRKSAEAPLLMLLEGAPGVGKTALMHAFLGELRGQEAPPLVLTARCYERELVPYKALDGLVDGLWHELVALGPRARGDLLPPDTAALARLFPVMGTFAEEGAATPAQAENPAALRGQALCALKALLGAMTRGGKPIVLLIDDLHWGDLDSARMLLELVEPTSVPLFVLATARSGERAPSPCLSELTRGLAENPVAGRLSREEVRPLKAATAACVARQSLGGAVACDADVHEIVAEANGNPLFIEELARHVLGRTSTEAPRAPLTFEGTIRARLSSLTPGDRRVLELLAVSGGPLEQHVLFAASVLGEQAVGTLKALARAHWLQPCPVGSQRGVDLYHQRIAEVLRAELDTCATAECHRCLAAALEAGGAVEPERIADHLYGAGDVIKASRYLRAAAERAAAALAFDRAAILYERLLTWIRGGINDTAERRRELGLSRAHALAYAGRCHEAAVLYEELASGAEPAQASELGLWAAEQFLIGGYFDRGVQRITACLAEVRLDYPRSTARALAEAVWLFLPVKLRGVSLTRARAKGVQASPELLRQIDVSRAAAKGMFDVDPLRGALFELRALRAALRAQEPTRLARALAGVAAMFAMQGRTASFARGDELLALACTLAEELRDPLLLAILRMHVSCHALILGKWQEAFDGFEGALAVLAAEGRGVTWERNAARIGATIALEALGRFPEATLRTAHWHREATTLGNVFASTTAALFAARQDLILDAPEQGHKRVSLALSGWSQRGFHVQHIYAARFQAEASLYEGDPVRALATLHEIWPAAERSQQLQVQFARFDLWELRGRAAVASAQRGGASRTLHGEALRASYLLARELRSDAAPRAALLDAAVFLQQGHRAACFSALDAAEAGFFTAGMEVHVACTRRRRGELLGGSAGEALVQAADCTLARHGVRHAERWARLVAPGLE